MDFAELISPLTVEAFLAEHYGRGPLHIVAPEGSSRRSLFGWEDLNALLRIQRHWSRDNIRLMRGGKAILPELYMEEVLAQEGRVERASPEKVEALLATGASLVAESVQQMSPTLRDFALTLADRLRGRVTAIAFCSFEGVAAFPRHFDSVEVFALQTEGEKIWRIYGPPARSPLFGTRYHESGGGPQPELELMMTATLRPGDVLYIPRGYSHDALASAGESLHISFAVDPPGGAAFFKLLKEAALHEEAFRAYLPDARLEDGGLSAHLDALAGRLAEIVRSPAFREEVATAQQKLTRRPHEQALPRRPTLAFYVRTKIEARLRRTDAGAIVEVADGSTAFPLNGLREEAEWILQHPMFSLQELAASFPHRPDADIAALIAAFEAARIVQPGTPR